VRLSQIVALAAGVVIGLASGAWRAERLDSAIPLSQHTGVSIEQVQALSSLVTAKVDVADVTETSIKGRTGGVQAALLVKGDFLLGTDLAQARFESVDRAAHTAVLVLPQPQVTSPRLDHDRTRVFAISESGLWQFVPKDGRTSAAVVNLAYQDAQRQVERACNDPSLLERARRQAESVLRAFFAAAGWQLKVRWQH
jgi:hypothetical protein